MKPLAILAVQQVAHRFSASRIGFALRFALDSIHARLGHRFSRFGAAFRTAVGEAWLVGLQLKLF
jgi:hypothetical protein